MKIFKETTLENHKDMILNDCKNEGLGGLEESKSVGSNSHSENENDE